MLVSPPHTHAPFSRSINFVTFCDEEQLLAAGDDSGYVRVWSLRDNILVQWWRDPSKGRVQGLIWACSRRLPPSVHCVTAMRSGSLQVRVKMDNEKQFTYTHQLHVLPEGRLECIASNHSGSIAVTGNQCVALIKVDFMAPHAPLLLRKIFRLGDLVAPVAFFNNGKSVLVGLTDSRHVISYNVETAEEEWSFQLPTRIGHLAWSQDHKMFAVYNLGAGVDIYQLSEEKLFLVHTLRFTERLRVVKHVEFAFRGNFVFAGTDDGNVRMWKLPEGMELEPLTHGSAANPPQIVKVLESRLDIVYIASATGGDDSTVRLWKIVGGELAKGSPTIPEVALLGRMRYTSSSEYARLLIVTVLGICVLLVLATKDSTLSDWRFFLDRL